MSSVSIFPNMSIDAAEQPASSASSQDSSSSAQGNPSLSQGNPSPLQDNPSFSQDNPSSSQGCMSAKLEKELAGQAEAMCSAMFHTGRMTVGRLFDIHDNGQIYLNSVVYQGPDSVGAVRKGDAATASSSSSAAASEAPAGSFAATASSSVETSAAFSSASEASAGSFAAAASSSVETSAAFSSASEASAGSSAAAASSSAPEAPVPSSAAFSEHSLSPGDRYIRSILLTLLDAKDGQGKRLMKEQVQWYAVYKVLSEKLGYPSMMTEFVRSMQQLGMDRVDPGICIHSMKKAPKNLEPLMKSVDCWPEYLCKAGGAVQRQILVAVKLLSLLGMSLRE